MVLEKIIDILYDYFQPYDTDIGKYRMKKYFDCADEILDTIKIGKMLKCNDYIMFEGKMKVKDADENNQGDGYKIIEGTWLYNPITNKWVCGELTYSSAMCEIWEAKL